MARRRAPKPPSYDAQRKVAGWPGTAKPWGKMHISPTEPDKLELLEIWVLPHHGEAAKITPRGRGRPTKWDQKMDAIRWLRAKGVALSDAPGSLCVRSLTEFLDQTRRVKYRGDRDSTAEELAGTLVALARTIKREQVDD